jgi:hypothetical protein
MSKMSKILAYSKPGLVDAYRGRNWFRGCKNCPFCATKLVSEQSRHRGQSVALAEDGNSICLECGSTGVPINSAIEPLIYHERYSFYAPLNVSPLSACIFRIAECANCGWWYVIVNNDGCNDGHAAIFTGILERFLASSKDLPLTILADELKKSPHLFSEINPYKLEDLVASILSGIYDCEVVQLGYSRDGGIDLILLHSDAPIAVQVKRRTDLHSTEGVSSVREFLAATLLSERNHGIFVTTAEKFSPDVKKEVQKATEIGLVRQFDLVDIGKLKYYLSVVPQGKNWSMAFESHPKGEDWPRIPCPKEYLKIHNQS